MVKRWTLPFDFVGPEMEASTNGEFVRHSDYEALRAELEAVKAANERLEEEKEAAEFAARHGESLSCDAIHEIRELLKEHDVPLAPFIDDHVRNAIVQRNQERDRAAKLEAENGRLRELLSEARDTMCAPAAAYEPIITRIDAALTGRNS